VAYRSAAFGFRWSAAQHRWLVWMNGKQATAADGGTTFTLPDGRRMPFAPGQVWVVFGYGPGSSA
jgi:hypothetical protein